MHKNQNILVIKQAMFYALLLNRTKMHKVL